MPSGQFVVLTGPVARERAKALIDRAPPRSLVNVRPERRTTDQNDKMWAMLSDISCAMPEGRKYTTEQWKAIFMNACGWEVQFLEGLDGQPFPAGFRSSRMSKAQMGDLINFIQAYGDQHGVRWTDPEAHNAA